MKNIEEYKKIREKLSSLENVIAEDVREKISETKDLPNIKRISDNCVTIPFSEIAANKFILSAEYYDTNTQIKALLDKISTFDADLKKIKRFLEDAHKNEFIKKSSCKLLLNRSVLQTIEEILEELKEV